MATKNTGAEAVRWNLSDLFTALDDPKIEEIFSTTKEKAESFLKQDKCRVKDLSSSELKIAHQTLESLVSPLYKLSQYSHLLYSVDTSDDQVKQLVSRVDEYESHVANLILFFDLELGQLKEDSIKDHQKSEELKPYIYPILKTLKQSKYHLSEKEEQLVNLKDLTGKQAFKKLYEEFTSSFQFEFEVDGELKKMNGSELRAMRYHPDKDVRYRAMKMFLGRYEENQLVLIHIFNNIIKSFNLEKDLRKYPSSISVMNIHNDLSDDSVAALHQV